MYSIGQFVIVTIDHDMLGWIPKEYVVQES